MADLTRRRFLTKGSLGLGLAVTGLAAATQLEGAVNAVGTKTRPNLAGRLPDDAVLHVKDVATGEFVLLVGIREIAFRDLELAHNLVAAVTRASTGRRI